MTAAIFDIPLQAPADNDPGEGLRSSTECVSRRYLEFVDPDRFPPFNEGVGAMGHLLADVWIRQAFEGVEHRREVAIPWAHGCSHIDVVVDEGAFAGAYEIKTTSSNPANGPSAANRRQVQRMLWLAEQAGMVLPGPFRVVIIGKAGNDSGWVRGPWSVTLPPDEAERIAESFALTDQWMRTEPSEAELRERCTCGGCFPKTREFVAYGSSQEDLLNRIDHARKLMLAAKDVKDEAHTDWKLHKAEYDELRKLAAEWVPDGVVLTDGWVDVSKRRDGAVTVREARA